MRVQFYDEPGDAGLSEPDGYDPGYDAGPDDDWPDVPLRPWGWWRQGWSRRGRPWPRRGAPASRYVRPPRKPGTTRDGYRLRLPHEGVHTILARLEPAQLRALAGGDLGADPARSVVRSVARIAGDARLVGTMRSRRSGARFPVFSGPGFRILARPTGRRQGEILLVRPAPGGTEGEMEVLADKDPGSWGKVGKEKYRVRGARVSIDWKGPYTLGRPPKVHTIMLLDPATGKAVNNTGSGVYVATKGSEPVYVGESDNFTRRWEERCHVIDELGLNVDLSPYRVWLGTITKANTPAGPRGAALVRKDVESVLIRSLLRAGKKLNNRTSLKEVLAAPQGVSINNNGTRPPFLQATVTLTSQTTPYEIGPL